MAAVLVALGVMGLLCIGALFGAWIVESDQKRHAAAPQLMDVVEEQVR